MATKILVEPVVEPVNLTEAKAWLRVDHTIEDDLINALIRTTRTHIEAIAGLAMITQTIQQTGIGDSQTGIVEFAVTPVQSVQLVARSNVDGTETILSNTDYQLDLDNSRIGFGPLGAGAAFRIEYIAGFGDLVTDVPEALKTAMLSQMARLFDHRDEPGPGLSHFVQSLLAPFVRVRL